MISKSMPLFLFLVASLPAVVYQVTGESHQVPVYHVLKTTVPIVVDGHLDDPSWQRAKDVGAFVNNEDGSPSQLRTQAKIVYDNDFIYFGFRVWDQDIWSTYENRDEHLWTEEVVEVFIKASPTDPSYIELEVNPLGTMLDIYLLDIRKPLRYPSWNSEKLRWAIDVTGSVDGKPGDTQWTCEMALPLEDVVTAPNTPPDPGDRWRVNLYRVESRPEKGGLAWSPTLKNDFHVPDMFGEIIFSDLTVP